MQNALRRLGIAGALVACLILCGCGSTTEFWKPETAVEQTELAAPQTAVSRTSGWLEVRVTQQVREKWTPVERLQLLHEKVVSTIEWDDVGMVTLYVLGSVVLAALYLFLYAASWWEDDSE